MCIRASYQGFDAFFHAAEGFIANCATPLSDLYALEAIRLIYKYLPVAVALSLIHIFKERYEKISSNPEYGNLPYTEDMAVRLDISCLLYTSRGV